MTRRNHPFWRAFAALAAALMLALPAQADEMEPDPWVEDEVAQPEPVSEAVFEDEYEEEDELEDDPEPNIGRFFDLVIVRPLYFARLVGGLPFFVFYPLTIASGYDEDVVALLWTEPFEATFERPLGEAPEEY